jgi:hypothetical protein
MIKGFFILLSAAFLTLACVYWYPQANRWTTSLEISTPTSTLPKNEASKPFHPIKVDSLSIFNLREICPEIFTEVSSVQEFPAWKILSLELKLPLNIRSMKKPLKRPHWDGRDFQLHDDSKSSE